MNSSHDEDDYINCSECGLVFDKPQNLAKHLHVAHRNTGNEREEQSDNCANDSEDKSVDGDEDEEVDGDEDEDGENQEQAAFENFFTDAIEEVRQSVRWQEKYGEFIAGGNSESEAAEMADADLEGQVEKKALTLYRNYLANSLLLQNGSVHSDVQDDLLNFWDKGFTAYKAAKMAVNKHKGTVWSLMELDSESSESSSETSSETGDDN